jgi:murein DD-endopeptidase MepM/ murein hydrolase activator NlpD
LKRLPVEDFGALDDNPAMDPVCSNRRFALAVLLAGGVLLPGACGWVEWPPSDSSPRPVGRPPASATLSPVGDLTFVGASAVIAGRGDSVYALSRRHRVPMRAIIEANGLRPPYRLRVGQRIQLPRPRTHVVASGDTLYGISRQYGVDLFTLARVNDLGEPYTILVDQRLAVPSAVTRVAVSPSAVKPEPPTAKSAPPAAASQPARPAPPPLVPGKGFLWPIHGQVLSGFGPKSKGLHNDGINIAATRGSAVRAAESGVVAYAGNELRGFGNLLLVKHAGGWVTAYAHNETLLVKAGDKVSKGQSIARVGSTGNVTKPQLHFELRRGKRAIDPRRHLVASRVSQLRVDNSPISDLY